MAFHNMFNLIKSLEIVAPGTSSGLGKVWQLLHFEHEAQGQVLVTLGKIAGRDCVHTQPVLPAGKAAS